MSEAEQRIAEIAARAEKATAGPWWVEQARQATESGRYPLLIKYRWDDVPTWIAESSAHPNAKACFEFMAEARQDIPWLLEQLKQARAALALGPGGAHE